ncbi:membrane-bound lytic murein transglycosylase MltF [Jeongeupia naejangsanensis]|uniref:Membrane-bound lytic murein transglycosylase MltF n=2 Tax=Jeongeupia naejangsanensis TaxID=613195 RepID=A0ABS2BPZ0_9NEIS|nr:membrane-bound lytic murein transglycosylase MltF [Jeongeupia naejangsanensis]
MPANTAPQAASWIESRELVVLVQNGPTTFYVDAEGHYAGLEYDLVTRFASENGLKVRFVVEPNYAKLFERLQRNEAHLAVGVHESNGEQGIGFGPAYQSVRPVLVYRNKQTEQAALNAINGGAAISTMPQYVNVLNQLKVKSPSLTWNVVEAGDSEELVEAVAQGKIDYAVIGSQVAELAQKYYPQVAISEKSGAPQQLAWAMQDGDTELQAKLKQFFGEINADKSLAKLLDRYYGHVDRIAPPDSVAFLNKRNSVLPRYEQWFKKAAAETNLDWRLLAALSYQESHWDPNAVSPFGVRGLMMLTTDTAQRMGVDRLNPVQSIQGGARYLAMLRDGLPDDIPEPDRTWLAMAAYNVGLGHLLDARELARRQNKNPDSWADIKTTLPLLRDPKYYNTVRFGYARGGEPVAYVETLRSFYDILVRFEEPAQLAEPRLAANVEVQNPANRVLQINNRVVSAKPAKAKPVMTAAL